MLSRKIEAYKCKLVEVEEKYFENIISWRNDPSINKYLNQPFKLTFKLQKKWYDNYIKDDTQMLYVIINENEEPVGTVGYTNIDYIGRTAVTGRFILDHKYRGTDIILNYSVALAEEAYKNFDYIYSHIIADNVRAIRTNIKNGARLNNNPKYPELCSNDKYIMNEYVSTKEDFYNSSNYKLFIKLREIEERKLKQN